tara:strand:- start:3864 stop:4718 length:855 start_codon:yes stop_codon:yes gene_type:complete
MNAIEVKNLNKSFSAGLSFKKNQVLKNLSFSAKPQCVTGFLGANGAGKTTTFKIMMGLLHADSGEVLIHGKPISNDTKKNLGFMPERPQFPDHLNAHEFMAFLCNFHHIDQQKNKIKQSLDLVGLKDVGNKLIKDFSKGMVQRLGLAQSIIHSPDLVILDEPMSGLDPNGRRDLIHIIKGIATSGTTVFLSSHLLDDVQRLCDDIVLIDQGKTLFSGSVEDIQKRTSAKFRLISIQNGSKKEEVFETYTEASAALQKYLEAGDKIIDFSPYQSFEQAVMELQQR